MECKVNKKKKAKLFNKRVRNLMSTQGKFVKFTYVLYLLLYLTAIVSSLWLIIDVTIRFQTDKYVAFEYILLLLTIGIPIGFAFICRAVFHTAINKAYYYDCNESISLGNECSYSHCLALDSSSVITQYVFKLNEIENVSYDQKAGEIIIDANIVMNSINRGKIVDKDFCERVRFLDIYDIDVIDFFKKNGINVKNI